VLRNFWRLRTSIPLDPIFKFLVEVNNGAVENIGFVVCGGVCSCVGGVQPMIGVEYDRVPGAMLGALSVAGSVIVNEGMARGVLAFEEASVTVIVQSAYVPGERVTNVTVFDPTVALDVSERHDPPYEIVPASSVVNTYVGVVSVEGVEIGVTSVTVGAVTSGVVKIYSDDVAVLPTESVETTT
jgi:hypothetical protein